MYFCIINEEQARKEQSAMLKRVSRLFPLWTWVLYVKSGNICRNYFTVDNSIQLTLAA